jgi:hypothetical protein
MSNEEKPYRVVVYKDGSPNSKVQFDSVDDAEDWKNTQQRLFAEKVKNKQWNPSKPVYHYIAERNY